MKPAVLLIDVVCYLSGMIGAWLFARALLYKLICILEVERAVYSIPKQRRAAGFLAALRVLPPVGYTAEQRSAWASHWRRYLSGAVLVVIVSQVCLSLISSTR